MNKRFYILSNDEMAQIEVVGPTLEEAIDDACFESMEAIRFFGEYDIEYCHVEEIEL